jgi:hypothetical protein
MNDAGSALTRFDFTSGEQRGSHLTLHPNCLIHRGEAHLETLPLATITSVRVSYEHSAWLIGWGVAMFVVAGLMYLISSPLASHASGWAAEVAAAGNPGVGRALYGVFRVIEGLANALPLGALVALLAGCAFGAFGWLGNTILTLTFAGAERVYPVRGRNTRLLDFSEAVADRLMQVKR